MDKKIEKFIKENSVDEGFLQDWYQFSADIMKRKRPWKADGASGAVIIPAM